MARFSCVTFSCFEHVQLPIFASLECFNILTRLRNTAVYTCGGISCDGRFRLGILLMRSITTQLQQQSKPDVVCVCVCVCVYFGNYTVQWVTKRRLQLRCINTTATSSSFRLLLWTHHVPLMVCNLPTNGSKLPQSCLPPFPLSVSSPSNVTNKAVRTLKILLPSG